MKYVNVYEVTRHYGGSEEGGWWYNRYSPLASVPFSSEEEARKSLDNYEEMYKDNNRGDIYSVLGGVQVTALVEDSFAEEHTDVGTTYE